MTAPSPEWTLKSGGQLGTSLVVKWLFFLNKSEQRAQTVKGLIYSESLKFPVNPEMCWKGCQGPDHKGSLASFKVLQLCEAGAGRPMEGCHFLCS